MPTKLQFYSQLATHSTGQLTKNRENWTSYLTTAARLYKYPFDEQVMIYTQRPEATACAPLETWNNSMNRGVKRGAKGIALIYEIGGEQRLRHVFDYADTEGGWRGRDTKLLNIWEMNKEHEAPVMDALVKTYGDMDGTLADMLHNIAYELAENYYNNNARDINYSIQDSFLESYDEDNVKVAFREAITISTGYTLMSRCGLNPDEFYEDEDWNRIYGFNTLNTVNALGTAVSELSEQILREIEATIKNYERSKTAERGTEYVSDNLNLQQERGLYASQRDTQGTIERADREIRVNAAESHQEPPQDILQLSASARGIETASTGNRPDSGTPVSAVDGRIDNAEPAAGHGSRPNGMGGAYEQPESESGGIYTERTDLQLNNQTEGAANETAPFSMSEDELSELNIEWSNRLIDSVIRDKTVMNALLNSDKQNTLDEINTAVSRIHSEIRQDILDSELIQNKGYHVNVLQKYIDKDRTPPLNERLYTKVVESEEYKARLEENTPKPIFITNDNDIHSMDLSTYRDGDIIGYNAKGVEFSLMRMGEHSFINTTSKITPWGEILGADSIPIDILSQISLANRRETETVTPLEQETTDTNSASSAEQSAEQENFEQTPEKQEYKYYSIRRPVDIGTYPREINPTEIVNFDRRQPVEEGLFEAWGYLVYPQPLTDAQIQDYELREAPTPVSAEVSAEIPAEINGSQFGVNFSENQNYISLTDIEQSDISLETLDAMLRNGGNKDNSVMRIAAHYMKDKTPDENAEFLMNEYGRGGKGLRIDNQRYTAWFDETGFTIAEGPSTIDAIRSASFTWEQVESRVRELMYNGQYIPQHRLDAVPDFERKELANKIWYLHQDTEDEYRIFIDNEIYRGGFPNGTTKIAELLSQPEQLNKIIEGLNEYCAAYEQDPDLLRFKRLHNPQELLQRLSDLRKPQIAFTANEIPNKSIVPFVTEDDIQEVLTHGGNYTDSKFRIFSYYLHEHTQKEKADFIKNEYGKDSKGIEITRGGIFEPEDKVVVPWSRAARLIDSYISEGQFMTRAELDRLPTYEKTILAREITRFYHDLPEDMPRPFHAEKQPYNVYTENEIREIISILDNPAQTNALIESMRPIWEVTLPKDRYYDDRQKAYADLTAYHDGTFTLFPQLAAAKQSEENTPELPNPALQFGQNNRQNEQLTLFDTMTVIEQSDIDAAIRNWNGDRDSKILVNEFMRESENARARKTADLLKQEYGGDLSAFTVEKDGAESVVLPWAKVQKRIAQLVADEQFLTPEEQVYLNNELSNTWDRLVAENTGREQGIVVDGSADQPIMVIDTIARNNYNLFALAFPQIVNGSYRSMKYENEENQHTLEIWHNTTSPGSIEFEISFDTPAGIKVYDPMATFQMNFENRMLKLVSYANTRTGEDIGYLQIPAAGNEQRLADLGVNIYEYLSGIKNQGFKLMTAHPFQDAEGKSLPAEPKQNIEAFLKEHADRESTAHGYVQRNMFSSVTDNNQSSETPERITEPEKSAEYLSTDLSEVSLVLRETITNHLLNSKQKELLSDFVTRSNATNKQITDMLSISCGYIADAIQLSDGNRAYYSTTLQEITVGLRDDSAAERSYKWDEIAPIIRSLQEQGLDGFGTPVSEMEQSVEQKQSAGLTDEDINYLRSRVIVTEFAEGEVVTVDSLVEEAVHASSDETSSRIIAGKVLQAVCRQRIDPIDYFNQNYASDYDFTQACIIRGYIETAVDKNTLELRSLPESERMPRPFPITTREWENTDISNRTESADGEGKGLLLMRNHFAELMPVVIDDVNGNELHRYRIQTPLMATDSVLAYSEQEAALMLSHIKVYTITSVEAIRETPDITAENTVNTPLVYYTPINHIQYGEGDIVASLSMQATINRIDGGYVYYSFPNEPDEYQMEQAQLEGNLDKGTHRIIGRESSSLEQTACEYAVGDLVYLENDRDFVIERINGSEINLSDTSLPISVKRTIGIVDFEALLQENPRNNHLLVTGVTQSEITTQAAAFPDGMPINKAVVDIFAQSQFIYHAKHTDGALYISNGFYIMKTTEQDFASLTEQINRRKRKTPDIEVIENQRLTSHIDNANGNFELLQKPYELGNKSDRTAYVYSDEQQYFEYDKKYVSVFENDGIRMFVNDNTSYDINSHSMVVKDRDNSILGIVLPISIPDELYERLADVLPLSAERKSEIERIKENLTNDPYIGREFFDGRNNHIVSGITKHDGVDMYTVPTLENGKLSKNAMLIKTDGIEHQIELWERNRVYAEQQKAADEIKAQEEAVKKAVYENTNGYADNLPPMQKANVLKALDGSFPTSDYGRLNVKQFIEAAVADGKSFQSHNALKKKYAEMDGNAYIRALNYRESTEAWRKYRPALTNLEVEDSPNAVWLKENHPFLYHKLYNDISVLDSSYLTLEYRLMMEENTFYTISKTAFDYGNYLINNSILEKQPEEMVVNTEAPVSESTPGTTALSSYERYVQAKEQYPEHIVLTKLGDFYELHGADAQYAADTFGYTVTVRTIDGQEIPLVGIPDKNADELINQIGALGKNVALVNSYGAVAEYPNETQEPEKSTHLRYEERQIDNIAEVLSDNPAFDRISENDIVYGVWDKDKNDWVRNGDGHVDFNSELGAAAEADQLNEMNMYDLETRLDSHSFETPQVTPVQISDTAANLNDAVAPSIIIAEYVKSKLDAGIKFSSAELFSAATKAYGDTMANNAFTSKDAYDAMELGVNQYMLSSNNISLESILKALDLLPTQTRRTAEMERFQQFSTPPSIAYLANFAANISADDTMLEPSAGIGGIAVFAKKDGAKVYVNELDKRRLEIIKTLPFDGFFNEDAEQINNIHGDKITPTVIVMNPPFASSAERNIQNNRIGSKHIEEALRILAPNGRLVAIAGQGMADDTPAFRNWWREIKEQYNVKANIGIDGKNYNKYGTTFGIQMIVIDKDGSTIAPVKTAFVENVLDLQNILGGIRNDRPSIQIEHDSGNERNPVESAHLDAVTEREPKREQDGLVSGASGGTDTGINRDRQEQTGASELDTVVGRNPDVAPGLANVSDDGNTPIVNGERHRGNDGRNDGDNGIGRTGTADSGQPIGSVKPRIKKELTDSIFENYEPKPLLLENVQPHPANISESAAMSAIEPPTITYKPKLSQDIIEKGVLSEVQLEAVTYAGQSHSQTLPNGNTRGFFLGDGTGVGKGRTITGVILDNYVQGSKKAVWLSENRGLIPDAKRDVKALFGDSDLVAEFEGGKKADKSLGIDEGILFVTYSALSKSYDQSGSNFEKIVNWLGKDFDGVIVFDEAHNMANSIATKGSRGVKKASQRGMAGLAIQEALPNAKIVYSSATGATEVENLRYAERLGLWGEGTAFPNGDDFVHKIKAGGLAAMELIARDMKAMGVYLSRNISYEDVVYDKIVHELTPEQRTIYDELARSWQIVLKSIKKALETTNQDKDGRAKGAAYSAFWGAEQRFFNQILTAMQVPSMIVDIQQQLDNDNSIVIQLVSTNESAQEREFSRLQEQELELDDFDLTPKQMLMSYIENSFPTVQFESYKDDNGNVKSKPVYDSEGNAVINREAVRQRDMLLDKLGSIKVPASPLDMIINHFGSDMVAENTGRKRRVVIKDGKAREENIANKKQADVTAFQNGDKRIIIFSKAGGTGKSYHADKSAKNQQHRVHYLLQAGWQADAAVQGFGRSHRSNQVSAPTFALVTTDLKGQMRFISTIAKRLDQLGALTKGQRQTGSQGLFNAGDNLENAFAADVLAMFYKILIRNGVNGIPDGVSIIEKLGLKDKLIDEYGGINTTAPELREVNKFLNRILSLECHEQNAVFDGYAERLHIATEKAMQDGTLDKGLENYRADKVVLKEAHDIRVDETTGATTKYYNLSAYNKIKPLQFADVNTASPSFIGFFQNKNTEAIRAVFRTSSITDEYGNISENCRLTGQDGNEYMSLNRLENNWELLTTATAEELWNNEVKELPEFRVNNLHLIGGTVLPVWDKLPTENVRIYRVLTSEGDLLIGRVIPEYLIDATLRQLGASREKDNIATEDLIKGIKNGDTVYLDNGWRIMQRKVSNEQRIEVIGADYLHFDSLAKKGVFTERIGYQTRYFIPAVTDTIKIMNEVIKISPVNRVENSHEHAVANSMTNSTNNGYGKTAAQKMPPSLEKPSILASVSSYMEQIKNDEGRKGTESLKKETISV